MEVGDRIYIDQKVVGSMESVNDTVLKFAKLGQIGTITSITQNHIIGMFVGVQLPVPTKAVRELDA
jgi:hypothetical protein